MIWIHQTIADIFAIRQWYLGFSMGWIHTLVRSFLGSRFDRAVSKIFVTYIFPPQWVMLNFVISLLCTHVGLLSLLHSHTLGIVFQTDNDCAAWLRRFPQSYVPNEMWSCIVPTWPSASLVLSWMRSLLVLPKNFRLCGCWQITFPMKARGLCSLIASIWAVHDQNDLRIVRSQIFMWIWFLL